MLIVKLEECPLVNLSVMLTMQKSEKIKNANYTLATLVEVMTSWALSEVDKPTNRYQNETVLNPKILTVGRGFQKGHRGGYGNYSGYGRGDRGKGRGRGKNYYNHTTQVPPRWHI